MRAAGLQVLVVAKPDSVLPGLDCPILVEPSLPRHPLCGIVAALRECEGRPLVVCACDMPFVTSPLLAWLGALDVPLAVADDGDRLHPLLGRYHPALLETLSKQLERQPPLTEVVAALGARIISARELERFGDSQRICLNVNTTAGLEHAERLLSGGDRVMNLPPHSADLAR
jgi:molybdenum cofactor guanylyltransferase